MAIKLFLNYRRVGDDAWAHALHKQLAPHADVFMDVDADIPLGQPWAPWLAHKVGECDAMVVLMGETWVSQLQARAEETAPDYVRAEIEAALQRGIPVIPVLLSSAALPSATHLPESMRPLLVNQAFRLQLKSIEADARELHRRILHSLANVAEGYEREQQQQKLSRRKSKVNVNPTRQFISMSLIGYVGVVISVAAMLLTMLDKNALLTPLMGALALLFIGSLALSARRTLPISNHLEMESNEEFYVFMRDWIGRNNDIAVFVKDLSWTKDAKIQTILVNKARQGQLTVIMQRANTFSTSLASAGASVFYYDESNIVPTSRFTMVNRHSHHIRVAVGWELPLSGNQLREPHRVVKVYEIGHDPFTSAAADLVNFMTHYATPHDHDKHDVVNRDGGFAP